MYHVGWWAPVLSNSEIPVVNATVRRSLYYMEKCREGQMRLSADLFNGQQVARDIK